MDAEKAVVWGILTAVSGKMLWDLVRSYMQNGRIRGHAPTAPCSDCAKMQQLIERLCELIERMDQKLTHINEDHIRITERLK
jgi:hypothetical protein